MASRRGKAADNNKGKHWKDAETELLLAVVEETLPRGQQEWLTVSNTYNHRRSAWMAERDEEQVRNKFKALRNSRKPTGDPTIPPNIRKAKRIQQMIEKRCSVASFDDSDSDEQVAELEIGSEREEEANEENIEEYLRDIEEDEAPTTAIVPFTQPLPLSVSTSVATPMTGPSSVSLSTGEASAPKSSGLASHDSKKLSHKTSERVGYTENELILFGKAGGMTTAMSESTRRKRKLDDQLDNLSQQSRNLDSQFALWQSNSDQRRYDERMEERRRYEEKREEERRREEARERREEERRAEERRREEARERREEERANEERRREEARERREEERSKREDERSILFMGLLTQLIGKKP